MILLNENVIIHIYFWKKKHRLGNEWGLPLAIAANLHLPYRIKIGMELDDLHSMDAIEKRKSNTAVHGHIVLNEG